MKSQTLFKWSSIAMVGLLMACSAADNENSDPNGDNNDDDGGNTNYTTVSQNIQNQEFFIEGIYFSGPGTERPITIPHSVTVPIYSRASISLDTDIDAGQIPLITIIGQRLVAPLVTEQSDITRVSRANEPYDSVSIFLTLTDDVEPNGTLETLEGIELSDNPFNDMFTQTNRVINNGRFKISAINPSKQTLGNTLDDDGNAVDPIQSITFVANKDAFQDPSNSFIETNGTAVIKYTGNFTEFLNNLFDTSTQRNIVILQTRTGINGYANTYGSYGL